MVQELDIAVCHGIIALRNNGCLQKEIARQYGISQGAVSKVLKRHAETGVPTSRPRPGRPKKTTARQDRLLTRMCTQGRTKSSNALKTEWQNATNVPVSRELVNKRLVSAGYYARRPLSKPLLQQRHRRQRLQWAREHHAWRAQHWTHVVFSDEARFEVYRRDGRVRVRRRHQERYNEACILPKVQAGGGGITIWGAFHAGGKSDLVVIDGNLNQVKYQRILEDTMLPFARGVFRNNFVYQDDNAPPHRARTVNDFLNNEGVERMDWPSISPDMNPIENLWAEITRIINNLDHQPTSVAELRQDVMDAWANIGVDTLRTLAEGMPRRVQALQAARGGHTKY